jgi:hypothetical protein
MSDGDAVVDEASGGGIVVDRTRDVLNMQCSDMQCSDMNGVLRGNLSEVLTDISRARKRENS